MKALAAAAFALISSGRAARAQENAIVPSPAEPALPAYQLHAETDLPVLGIGGVFLAARLTRTEKAFCAPLCNPDDLNALDRTPARYYSRAWVAGLGGAMAAFVATGRVFAGMHFITDAVSGAVVGTSVGVLVPALHGSPVRIVPLVGEGPRGIGVIGSF